MAAALKFWFIHDLPSQHHPSSHHFVDLNNMLTLRAGCSRCSDGNDIQPDASNISCDVQANGAYVGQPSWRI
jgi:hypothetical protein